MLSHQFVTQFPLNLTRIRVRRGETPFLQPTYLHTLMPPYETDALVIPLGNSQTKVTPFSQIRVLIVVRSIDRTAFIWNDGNDVRADF